MAMSEEQLKAEYMPVPNFATESDVVFELSPLPMDTVERFDNINCGCCQCIVACITCVVKPH